MSPQVTKISIKDKLLNLLQPATREHLEGFLEYQYSDRTRKTYLALLYRFVLSEGRDPLVVTSAYLEAYVRRQIAEGVKPQTVRTTVNTLRSFFNYVHEHDESFQHPTRRFRLRIPKTINEEALTIRKKLLTVDQVKIILDRIQVEEARAGKEVLGSFLFKFLLNTGLRIFEAVSLDHFNPESDSLTYHNYLRLEGDRAIVKVLGKARKLREFSLSLQFSSFLKDRLAQCKPGTPVFLNSWKTGRLSRFSAHYQVKQLQARFMADMNLHAFGLHALRHTTIGFLLNERGEHPIHVARVVGNSPEILSRYYLHDTKDLLRDVNIAI